MVNLEYLQRIPFFEGLDEHQLAELAPLVSQRRYPKNAVVFHEGDPVETIYFLDTGLVKVYSITDDGREQTLNLLRPGDFFPHVGFLEGGSYPATAQAIQDSRIAAVRRTELLELLQHNGHVAVQLLKAMGRRINSLQQRVKDLTHRNLHARVAMILLRLAEEHGSPAPEGSALNIHITHQELANLIGAARESVSRTLGEFKKDGFIGIDTSGRLLINKRALLEYSSTVEPRG